MSLSRVKPRNLPLKWCGYEVALRKLMEQLGRQTLSLQECEFVGSKLGFDPPSLKACLHYLRKFHIISFYDVLPDVIFGSSQVILDKITELVTYSLQLKKGDRALSGVERRFYQQGILSSEILQSEACSKHYKRKYFTEDDLLIVLKSLLIITEIGANEYLMPCVLEVSDIYPSPPLRERNVRSSFVLHFSKKSPMIGIYCCIISYLLTEARWRLLTYGGEVVQVSRNSVAFELPQNLAGKLSFIDPLSSYLEVVVELPAIIAARHSMAVYHEIRDTFFAALKQAMCTLNYEMRTPELSFLCPEQSSQCSAFPHLARVDPSHSFLTCSINPSSVTHPLTPDQKIWLHKPDDGKESLPNKTKTRAASPISISGEDLTLPQLLKINLPSRVGPKYNTFGTLLLQDDLGNTMAIMRERFRGDPEEITIEVLRQWLKGKGMEVSWQSLISTLRNCELPLMADQIQTALDQP